MHYNWHRHYDPSIGRYTQPDPLGFVDGPSQYAYAASDPISYVDPDGKAAWFPLIAAAGRCALNQSCRKAVAEVCKRGLKKFLKDESGGRSSKQRRKEWEKKHNEPWPKDPDTGNNQDVHHKDPLADGGEDTVNNVEPKTRKDHIQHHKDRGDFVRWGRRRWQK